MPGRRHSGRATTRRPGRAAGLGVGRAHADEPAADQAGRPASVTVSVKDAGGQERLHTFTLAVRDGKRPGRRPGVKKA